MKLRPKILALAVATLGLALAGPAWGMTASEYFSEGNRLFRDDLYFAALLRYEQAADAGIDTPLLKFNTGVAHYRAGQYRRARESLLEALPATELRSLAQYNLGLTAYAQGHVDEALDWFRLARDQLDDDIIARYAEVAISRILSGQVQDDPIERKARNLEEQSELSRLKLNVRISFGTDSNPFRTPSEDYIDYADPSEPLVMPSPQPGAFMPVSLGAKYQLNAYENEGFFGAYRMDGRFYQAQELENANEMLHEFSFGSEYRRRDEEENRDRRLYSAFRIAQHDQVYFDPVDGSERSINDIDVSDRFSYVRYGPELAYRQYNEKFSYGFRGRAELWNYENVEEVPQWDHEYFLLSGYGQYAVLEGTLLRLKLTGYSRRFGDRRARDLDGTIDIDNENLTYNYLEAEFVARQRFGERFWFGIEYEVRQREDTFEGYADYTRNSYGAEVRWGVSHRFDIEVASHYRQYDFPNAFAFHNPTQGPRTLEAMEVNIMATYRMTQSLKLIFEAVIDDRDSTDTRIAYQRSQMVLGVEWAAY